ncbi:hypothetical protein ACTBAC_004459 [Vibrio parahaemolyticus]|uniref:hypothetical protein n=6 Tax=Vibrio parahaemolyticus TaxID=670 RepID=UPI000D73EF73|nr:hypothetical protein [Vibrio parahaemolyticus]EGU9323394.1 hypothetical protein [Vibrio parahaemolyticus]EIA3186838.1 hypothetical protein [Vibrio parahaemolyticus]MCR9857004.1 hypothetical protein [Vibrio parahaemolyticus]MDF4285459.1 hypothetical protein [Vibrio parahaemolyticus]MDF4966718.1 hypothetical protein [Vibrio parahaemolyticus]
MEQKIAHLTFIQGVINRMGQNSFLLKGWGVTIVAALFALAAQGANKQFVLVAYFPAFMFWLLDAFFLHQERLFRKLYEKVASGDISSDDFTLNTELVRSQVDSYPAIVFSKTLLPFYGCIIGVLLFVMFGIFF